MPDFSAARRLDDRALLARLDALAAGRRASTAELVAHLGEVERRDLHLRQGYASVFVYARDALAVAEHEAYGLVAASRAARRFPVILDLLAEGAIHVTAVKLLAPCLTADNHRQVLEMARGKRRAQVEQIVATLAPQPEMPDSIRRLLSPGVRPQSTDRFQIQVTVAGETVEKLRLARDMLRHTLPAGHEADVLERALTALLADLARKKFAATERPRSSKEPPEDSRNVPAEVKRAVWLRDLGRCAFVSETGRRCGERAFMEFHHVQPYAEGGEPTVENIQLRCRQHNDYEARVRGLA